MIFSQCFTGLCYEWYLVLHRILPPYWADIISIYRARESTFTHTSTSRDEWYCVVHCVPCVTKNMTLSKVPMVLFLYVPNITARKVCLHFPKEITYVCINVISYHRFWEISGKNHLRKGCFRCFTIININTTQFISKLKSEDESWRVASLPRRLLPSSIKYKGMHPSFTPKIDHLPKMLGKLSEPVLWCILICMMTSSNGNIFSVTGPLLGESTGHR